VLTRNLLHNSVDQLVEQNSRDVQQILLDEFSDIKRRNEALLFCTLPTQVMPSLSGAVADIQVMFYTVHNCPRH